MSANTSNRVRDPVCGMLVDPAKAAAKFDYHGQTYYFCNPGCLKKFQAQPDVYLSTVPVASGMQLPVVMLPGVGDGAKHSRPPSLPLHSISAASTRSDPSTLTYVCPMDPEVRQTGPGACPKCGMALEPETIAPPASRTEWTCPMHPEIVRDQPGSCPICGMALEPRTVTAVDEPNHELVDMSQRFWLSLAFSVPLFVIAMTDMLPGHPWSIGSVRRCCAGCSSRWPRQWCCGGAGRFSSAAGNRSSIARSTCSR